ncbi:MAG: ABC transporter permease [Acidobacteriota bacterium]|nr:ABC transporter permease [Acidobacteriota bacterium]
MNSIIQDVRYALRALLQNKGFAAVALVTLAIGIGVNTAIFSIVNAVVLRPLPFPDADRLFVVYEQHPAPVNRTRLSSENFLDLQRESRAFDALGGYIGTGFTFSSDGDPELVIGQMVSAEVFTALGVQPLIGRTIRPEENEGGRDRVLVLSHALWQRRFGGDPSVVGRVVTVNARPYTIVGVMPKDFEFPSNRANVTNLLLARASAREREVAVRTALGAGRWRLVRQLLTETLVLYGVGAGAGVLLAAWGLDLLVGLSPADIPRLDQTALDRTTLFFTLTISLLTGLLFGILPALQTTKHTSSNALRSTARSVTTGRASQRVRATLVAAEVALSLMLLVGAGLAARSLQHVLDVDTGVRTDGVLTFNLVPPEARYADVASVIRFHRDVVDRLQTQPGVISAGASTHLPLSGQNTRMRCSIRNMLDTTSFKSSAVAWITVRMLLKS